MDACTHLLMTGMEKVMRSGGGLGDPSMGSTQAPSRAAVCGQLGNSDATCPSGPMPSRITSNMGSPAVQHNAPLESSTHCTDCAAASKHP